MSHILIIAPNWIGDAVMAEPLITEVKKLHPNSEIHVLATPWVASVMRAVPAVSKIISADLKHGLLEWAERKAIAGKLAEEHYTHAYVLPNSLKSALIPWMAHIPNRIGYKGEMRWGLLNQILSNPSRSDRPPMSSHYLALAKPGDLDIPYPQLIIHAELSNAIKNKLQGLRSHQQLYILCPGAEYGPAKQWPTEHFSELAKLLVNQQPNCLVLILGSKKEASLGEQIKNLSGCAEHIINWCGETSLDEAMASISLADEVISNDSGLMHIAAALGRPQVAIFGSSDPRHTPPLSKKAKVHWLHLECSPCFKRVCPLGHTKCLVDISPKDILNSLSTTTH